MKLEQQPWACMRWVDGTVIDRSFDDSAEMLRFIADSVRNDPHVWEVRTYSKPAPARLRAA